MRVRSCMSTIDNLHRYQLSVQFHQPTIVTADVKPL
jgi:hypothetical protein